jgi:serine/threonine-protein kinase RsbT
MAVLRTEVLSVRSPEDIVHVRQTVRAWAVDARFSLIEQTKVVTAASEIARNTVVHGGGGTVQLEELNDGPRRGLRLVFEDKGPGIPDIDAAFRDGFTTGGGLGLGLGGARRLSSEFDVWSRVGEGTRITLTRWR